MLLEEEKGEKSEDWVEILKPVTKMKTNHGSRIKKTILKALTAGPPAWAEKMLEDSISKGTYKPNGAGPTKRAVLFVLSKFLGTELKLPRHNPKRKHHVTKSTEGDTSYKIPVLAAMLLTERCRQLLQKLRSMEKYQKLLNLIQLLCSGSDCADRAIGLTSREIRSPKISPICMGSVDVKMASGIYGSRPQMFVEDLQKVWINVIGVANEIIFLAKSLGEIVETEYRVEMETLGQLQNNLERDAVNQCSEKQQQEGGDPVSEPEKRCSQKGSLLEGFDKVHHKVADMATSTVSVPTNSLEDASCRVCGLRAKERDDISCSACSAVFHEGCLLEPILVHSSKSNWLCESCVCRVCRIDKHDDLVLLCDSCDRAYHTYCLQPPLPSVPQGHWFCGACINLKDAYENLHKKTKTERRTPKAST